MKNKDHSRFLIGVQAYIEENPEVAGQISDYVTMGLQTALNQQRERAADMEVALSVAIAQRWKNRESLIVSKLKKWVGKSSVPWESTIELLESKSKSN